MIRRFSSSVPGLIVAAAVGFLSLVSCGGEDGSEQGAGGSQAGQAGSIAEAGAASQAGASGMAMLGTSMAGAGDFGGVGAMALPSTTMSESGAGGAGMTTLMPETGPLAVLAGCPEIFVQPYPGQAWAIVALNLVKPQILIQNVSDVVQELTTNHQWCFIPKYERLLPLDVNDAGNLQTREFEPGEVLWVNLVEGDNADGDDANFIDLEWRGGEIALYEAPGTYRDSDRIMAFMSWNDGNPLEGREAVAAEADIWDYGDWIELDPRFGGIVATGDTTEGIGYTSVPLACLPQREN